MTAHTRAVGQLVAAALLWSLGGLLIKAVAWPPLAVAGGRGAIAAVVLLALQRRRRFTFSRDQMLGAVAYAGCTVLFCVATKLTTAANAIVLQYTAPIWIALAGAWWLGERATRQDWVVIGVVLAGMVLFFADGFERGHLWGDILAGLSGMFFAAMAMALRRQKHGSPVESVILGNGIGFLIGLPWIVRAPALPGRGWAALLALGAIQLGVSYWLYTKAIRHVRALEAVLIPVIEPILNPVWVLLALGERPSRLALVGAAIVLTAVTLRAVRSIRLGAVDRVAPVR